MKLTFLKFAVPALLLAIMVAGCKKKETTTPPAAKKFTISELDDTSGVALTTFTYDGSGKVIKFFSPGSSFDYYYNSASAIVKRTFTSSGSVTKIDSFFYNVSNQLVQVVNYDGSLAKVSTTFLTYNGDGTLNSLAVDYESALTNDELYDYTYSGGNLTKRLMSEKVSGVYKQSILVEFLGYDAKPNPFYSLYQKYLLDQTSLFVFVWSYQNNVTTAKQTNYDLVTGNPTGVTSATINYTYNADGLPERLTLTQGSITGGYIYKYLQL